MPAPTTREQFLDLVRQSGLLAADELAQRVNDPAAPLPDGPREVAELFIREKLLTNFQAQRLLWGQFRGFLLGNYRVLDQIGAGGMGAVYLCEHRSLARRVAIKVLPPDRCQDALTVERFYREARAVAALNHPNIVRAFDVDSVGNLHFLVMEYVEGRTLHELVHKHGPQDVGRAAGYVRQAALGLQHVHEAGLVHRDVKPGNLLRDKHGVIKLLDLGLARFFTANDEGLTRKFDDKSILGTADYIAPEQAMNSHDVDIRADIYSLGATFYHLLTGRPPFEGGSVAQKLLWHQMRNPEPVRAVRPEVPEELAAVLDRMMLKNPDRRFQTPAEVAAALAPWVPGSSAGMSGTRLSGSVAKLTLPPEPELIAEPPRDQSGIFDWDAIADGATTDPNGAGRTLKDGKGRGGPKSHRKRPAAAGRRRLAVIAAVAGGLLVLGVGVGGAWWAMARARPGEVPARPAAAAPPGVQPGGLLVVQAGGGDGAFPTLREALAQARPGQRVQVRGDLEEAVKLEGPGLHDLVLEGVPRDPKAEPRLAAWRPPANHPAGQPLLQVTGVPGLRVKGFLFDGQNRVQDGLAVAGVCPGLTVEDCQIQGCQRAGVVLRAARGEGKRPLTLDRVRVVGSEKAAGEAAVLLAPGKNADDPVQYVTVRWRAPRRR
jgi:tRNA A-37 threonylcarbamoyl transferase component Bud32